MEEALRRLYGGAGAVKLPENSKRRNQVVRWDPQTKRRRFLDTAEEHTEYSISPYPGLHRTESRNPTLPESSQPLIRSRPHDTQQLDDVVPPPTTSFYVSQQRTLSLNMLLLRDFIDSTPTFVNSPPPPRGGSSAVGTTDYHLKIMADSGMLEDRVGPPVSDSGTLEEVVRGFCPNVRSESTHPMTSRSVPLKKHEEQKMAAEVCYGYEGGLDSWGTKTVSFDDDLHCSWINGIFQQNGVVSEQSNQELMLTTEDEGSASR